MPFDIKEHATVASALDAYAAFQYVRQHGAELSLHMPRMAPCGLYNRPGWEVRH